jgi:hypothetical protein
MYLPLLTTADPGPATLVIPSGLQAVDNDASLADIHAGAEKFSPLVEQVFKYLQIISAAAMSFAHGANDVANAVGPFAAIYGIYKYGYISSKSQVEMWMLAGIGATGESRVERNLNPAMGQVGTRQRGPALWSVARCAPKLLCMCCAGSIATPQPCRLCNGGGKQAGWLSRCP